ncbi:MAG: hypothetical protein WCL18_08645 [bacterium]
MFNHNDKYLHLKEVTNVLAVFSSIVFNQCNVKLPVFGKLANTLVVFSSIEVNQSKPMRFQIFASDAINAVAVGVSIVVNQSKYFGVKVTSSALYSFIVLLLLFIF